MVNRPSIIVQMFTTFVSSIIKNNDWMPSQTETLWRFAVIDVWIIKILSREFDYFLQSSRLNPKSIGARTLAWRGNVVSRREETTFLPSDEINIDGRKRGENSSLPLYSYVCLYACVWSVRARVKRAVNSNFLTADVPFADKTVQIRRPCNTLFRSSARN